MMHAFPLQSAAELWLGFTGTAGLVRLSPSPLLDRLSSGGGGGLDWDDRLSSGGGGGLDWDDRLLLNTTVMFSDHNRIQLVRRSEPKWLTSMSYCVCLCACVVHAHCRFNEATLSISPFPS